MHTVYLDNAATSFPKPPTVGARMREYVDEVGASVNRGSYQAAQQAELVTLRLRQRLCALFRFADPAHVILTPGNTWGLNMLLLGALRPGDHVLVSAMEHNAVMRPLTQLAKHGVAFDRIPCDAEGRLQADRIETMLRPNTRLVLLAHASNVSGTVQDAAAVGEICAARGIAFALDAAQTAGHIPLDFTALHLSALSVPAHKGLMGPQGIGALLLRPDFAETLEPIVSGGTGSVSDSEDIPLYLPDRFEPGTPNLPGIYGWEAALEYLEGITVEAVAAHDRALTARLLGGLREIPGVVLVGSDTTAGRVGVFSLDFPGKDNAEIAARLEEGFGILTRCGLHCAPSAHRTLGTFPRGTVRLSLGWFNTEDDIDRALQAVKAVSAG
ncbi:aminotransferase class V-fold PLP-dependent enzyme [Agathobaculum sp.]|uniref:aminotransferase class V-fold PLP-dependent enzyme n=1 Tax=Agathobaculum sp. TaxID=2048138 RepID=UPI0027B8C75F|nr:aminotransferase class V-fold PLP-dependent enzyme [Agathobaculum sp.]